MMKLIFLVMALAVVLSDAGSYEITTNKPVSRFGSYRYFVKWDNKKIGGRFFECDVYDRCDKGDSSNMDVVAHDGDTGTYSRGSIFWLGVTPKYMDDVIAYFGNRAYAFYGKVILKRPGEWFVHFLDGDKAWIRDEWVHKKVKIASNNC